MLVPVWLGKTCMLREQHIHTAVDDKVL